MKRSAVAVLGAASTASAQQFVTSTYVECTQTAPRQGTVTESATMTATVCDLCEHASSTNINGQAVHVTAWTTVYDNICSTGLVPVTYTVTESCTGETPNFTGAANTGYVPPGFTTSMVDCHVCETPGPVPMTFPISQGPTVAPAPTPAPEAPAGGAGGNGGSNPAPAGSSGGSGSGAPAAPAPNANAAGGSSPAGAPAPAAPASGSGSSASGECNGEDCAGSSGSSPAAPTGGASAAGSSPSESSDIPCDGCADTPNGLASNGTGAGITPYNPNSASKATISSLITVVIAAAGFMML